MTTNMKTAVLTSVFFLFFTLFTVFEAASQCEPITWPEDKSKAETSLVLLKDNKTNGHFKQAVPPLQWLLTNAPKMHTSVYIYGLEVYDGLAKAEKDPAKKQVYVDSLMLLYDMRMQNCGEEASVIQRKALHAAYYNANTNGKEKEVLDIMDKAIELNGENIMDALLVPYMQVIKINKLKLKNLTDDQVLERYDNVSNIIDSKIKQAQSQNKPIDKLQKTKDDVDAILTTIITVDCDFVKKNMEPKFRANPSDVKLAKKMFSFMVKGKCTDDPLWMEVAEVVVAAEPDFTVYKTLGLKYFAQENYAKTDEMFKKALPLASSPRDKSEILIYQAGMETKKGDKPGARQLLQQALAADPSNKEPYEKIGDLYMTAFTDCAKEKSLAEDRLVFIAAYEMYAKAGNQQKMAQAKAQFPSKTELFEVNWNEGDTKKIEDCWVGETVVLRTRPAE